MTPQRRCTVAQRTRYSHHLTYPETDRRANNLALPQPQLEYCPYLFLCCSGKEKTRFPVVLFIHGESYSWGSGNVYDGTGLAAFSRVVVVTINYRLGVLGKQLHRAQRFWAGSMLAAFSRVVVVTINYRLGALGKQLHRAQRFWAGSMLAAFSRVVVVTINYRLGVLGKQLHRARRFWAGSMLAAFSRVVVITINYRLGVLGKQLTQAGGFGLGQCWLPSPGWS